MTQTLHIFRKDVRRLRWWLAAWVVLLAVRVLLVTSGWRIAGDGLAEQFVLEQANGVIGIATLLMFGLLVAQLVHDEPTVGLDWFWLTRPYDRGALLRAKLGFALLFFIVVPMIGELIVMAVFDAGPADMLRASPVFLARDMRWTLGLLVFAVLTPTLVMFALGIVGTAAGLSLLMFGILTVLTLRVEQEAAPPSGAAAGDPTPVVLATIVFLAAALAVVVYQYRRRRPRRALLLLAIGLAAVIAVPALWPWSLVRARALEPPAWAADPDRVAVSVDRDVPPEISDELLFGGRARRNRQVYVPVALTGLPPGYRAQGLFADSELELAGGHVLRSRQSGALLIGSGGRSQPLQGALGDVRVYPAFEPDRPPMTPLLSVTEEELAQFSSQPGRLSTTLFIPLYQSREIGALPLSEQASLRSNDTRVEIVRIQRRHDGCILVLRQWQVGSLLSLRGHRQHDYVLRNVARGEAMVGDAEHPGFAGSSSFLLLFGFMPARAANDGFALRHFRVQFGRRWPGQPEQLRIDAQWLDGADLVVVETAPAGTIRRSITIDGFRMQTAQ